MVRRSAMWHNDRMGILLGIAVLVLDVICALDVFRSAKDPEKKILWLVLIFLLPLLGPLLYYVLARRVS
jgi:hypothetical protein